MKKIKVKILGAEVEANLLNPDVAENYEKEYTDCIKKIKGAIAQEGKNGIKLQCMAVIEFIETVFGKGAAKKVLGEETDLLTCLDALDELTSMYEDQVNHLITERTASINKKIDANLKKA